MKVILPDECVIFKDMKSCLRRNGTSVICSILLFLPSFSTGNLTRNGTKDELLKTFEPANRVSGLLRLKGVNVKGKSCEYSYELFSNSSSRQSITEVALGMPDKPGTVITPRGWVTNAEIGLFVEDNKRRAATGLTIVSWMTLKEVDDLKPGKFLDGFKVASEYLPGIKPFWLTGRSRKMKPLGKPTEAEKLILIECLDPYNNSYCAKTIGPDEMIGRGFNQEYYLERLVRLVNESESSGWISSRETSGKLRKILGDAMAAIKSGNKISACLSLTMFNMEIKNDDKENCHSIRNDAGLMLMINSEYIRWIMCPPSRSKNAWDGDYKFDIADKQ